MTEAGEPARLPVHGFVLAGGKSSRMGRDKAMLPFNGQPMIKIALAKLRLVCADVAIAGNRADLSWLAPVVPESLYEAGPAAGMEAGLRVATQPWVLFVPVDIPLLPMQLVERWLRAALTRPGNPLEISYLTANGEPQPAICLLHKSSLPLISQALEEGERKLTRIFARVTASSLWVAEAEQFCDRQCDGEVDMRRSFANVNRPEDLVELERWCSATIANSEVGDAGGGAEFGRN